MSLMVSVPPKLPIWPPEVALLVIVMVPPVSVPFPERTPLPKTPPPPTTILLVMTALVRKSWLPELVIVSVPVPRAPVAT